MAFWNATVQGMDKFYRIHKENPKRTVVKGVVSGTLPAMLLYALNRNNPDYQELPRWQKDFNWMIPTRGTSLEEETPFIPIPKGFLFGLVYGTMPERVMEWIDTKDPAAFDELLETFSTSVPYPLSAVEAIEGKPEALIPPITAITPLIDIFANRSSFTGTPLVPGYMQRIEEEYQAHPWTSEFSKKMAWALARMGIKASPIKLDHALFGYTGGLGRAVAWAANPLFGGEQPGGSMIDTPGLRAFVVRFPSGQARSIQKFYDRLNELEKRAATARFADRYPGRVEGADKLAFDQEVDLKLFRDLARYLSGIRADIRGVETSDLIAKGKKAEIDELYREMIRTAQDALGAGGR